MADTSDIREIPPEILQKLCTDQKNCYKLISPVKEGNLPAELAKILCGELSTARWNTTGEALILLWMSDHGLTGEQLRILEVLVRFTIDVYFKMYYDIKVLDVEPQHISDYSKTINHTSAIVGSKEWY